MATVQVSQPAAAQPYQAVADEEAQQGPDAGASYPNSFSSSVFGCFANIMPSCLMAFCCLPFSFARIKTKTGIATFPGKAWVPNLLLMLVLLFLHKRAINSWHKEEHAIIRYDEREEMTLQHEEAEGRQMRPVFINPAAFQPATPLLLMCVIWYLVFDLRRAFRERYRISQTEVLKDDRLEDVTLSVCCTSCVLAQMDRHVSGYADECSDLDVCAAAFMPPSEDQHREMGVM